MSPVPSVCRLWYLLELRFCPTVTAPLPVLTELVPGGCGEIVIDLEGLDVAGVHPPTPLMPVMVVLELDQGHPWVRSSLE